MNATTPAPPTGLRRRVDAMPVRAKILAPVALLAVMAIGSGGYAALSMVQIAGDTAQVQQVQLGVLAPLATVHEDQLKARMIVAQLGAVTPEARADVARIDALWRECLAASGGPFLFGEFGIADAMYAPVVMRFNSYQPALSPEAAAYAARVTALPAVAAWIEAGRRETHVVADDEIDA